MSLINEALKRADAERGQKPYAPPPIEEAPAKPAPRRRRPSPSRLTSYIALGALGVVCAAAGAWAIVAFVGQPAGPEAAYGLDTQRRVEIPRDVALPEPTHGEPKRARPVDPRQEPDVVQPETTDPPTAQPRATEPDYATSQPTLPEEPTETEPTQPLLTGEDLQRIAAGTSRSLSGMLNTGIAIGGRVDDTLRDVVAFASAHERAQQEMARQRAEQRRLAREEAQRRRRQEEAEAQRLARQKAQAEAEAEKRRREALAAQQAQAQRLAREQAQAAARARARQNDSAASVTASAPTDAGTEDKPEFVLNGILFSYDRTDAVINNKPYRLNETVNGAKVIHIERTMVKLLYKGEVIVLRL